MTNIVQTNSVHKLLLTVLINMVLIGCTACSTKENYTKESQIINHIDEEVINNVLKSQLAYTYFLLQNEYIISKINNPNYYDEIDNRLEFIKRIKNTDYITYSTDESENNFKIYTKPTSKADVLKSADTQDIYGIKWFKRLITNFSMPTDNIVLFSFIIKPLEFAKKLGYSREIEYSGKAIILPNPEDGNPEVTLVRYFERKTNLWEKTDFIKYKHNAWYLSTKFDKPNIESFTIDIKDTFKEEIKNVRKEYQQYSPKITQVLREATLESLKYDSFIKHLYKIIYNNDRKDLDYYKIGTDIFRNIGNKGLKRLSVTQLENNMSIISNAFLKSDTIQCEKMMEGEVDFDVFDNLDIEDVRKFYDISIKATIAELEDNPPVIIISKAQKTASEKALLQALNNNFTQGEIERLRRILKKEPMYYDNYCSLIARFYNTILQINMPEKEWVLRSIF